MHCNHVHGFRAPVLRPALANLYFCSIYCQWTIVDKAMLYTLLSPLNHLLQNRTTTGVLSLCYLQKKKNNLNVHNAICDEEQIHIVKENKSFT